MEEKQEQPQEVVRKTIDSKTTNQTRSKTEKLKHFHREWRYPLKNTHKTKTTYDPGDSRLPKYYKRASANGLAGGRVMVIIRVAHEVLRSP